MCLVLPRHTGRTTLIRRLLTNPEDRAVAYLISYLTVPPACQRLCVCVCVCVCERERVSVSEREREREREFFESIQSCGSLKSGQYAVEELEAVTKKTQNGSDRQTKRTL